MTSEPFRTLLIPGEEGMDWLASVVAAYTSAGTVIVLDGSLGAGKTRFVQGLARAMGIEEPVTSPTYVLQTVYGPNRAGLHLAHYDVYRLGTFRELMDLGFTEFAERSVSCVEWGGKFVKEFPAPYLRVVIEGLGREPRRVFLHSNPPDRYAILNQALDSPAHLPGRG